MAMSITISQEPFEQAQSLAQELNISQSEVFEMAIATYIKDTNDRIDSIKRPKVNQGDIHWLRLDENDTEIPHPYVIIQADVFNHSRIDTVVVCAVTSNLKRGNIPGNLLLESGEGNLPKQSVIEVSKISSLNKSQLGEYIGTLSEQRVKQILAGIRFLQSSYFTR